MRKEIGHIREINLQEILLGGSRGGVKYLLPKVELKPRPWVFFTLAVILSIFSSIAFGDQIHLKDGSIIGGIILSEDESSIYIKVVEQEIKLDRNMIRSTEKEEGEYSVSSEMLAHDAGEDEKTFKEAVMRLEKIYAKFDGGRFLHDTYEKKMLEFKNRLKIVYDKYPNSKWADDAGFLLANLFPFSKQSVFKDIFANIVGTTTTQIGFYKQLMRRFPHSPFEEWTAKNCIVGNIGFYSSFTVGDAARFELASFLLATLPNPNLNVILLLFEELINKYKSVTRFQDAPPLAVCYDITIGIYEKWGNTSKVGELKNEVASKHPEGFQVKAIPLDEIKFWLSQGENETNYKVHAIYLKKADSANKFLGHTFSFQSTKGKRKLFTNITYNAKNGEIYGEYWGEEKKDHRLNIRAKIENGILRLIFPDEASVMFRPYVGLLSGIRGDSIVIFIPQS